MRGWGLAVCAAMIWALGAGAQTPPATVQPEPPPAVAAEPRPEAPKPTPQENSEALVRAVFAGSLEGARTELIDMLTADLRNSVTSDPSWRRMPARDREEMEKALVGLPDFLFGELNFVLDKIYPLVAQRFTERASPEDLAIAAAFFTSPTGAKVIRKMAPVAMKYAGPEGKPLDQANEAAAGAEIINAMTDSELVAMTRFFSSPTGQRMAELFKEIDPDVRTILKTVVAAEEAGIQRRTLAFLCKQRRSNVCPRT
jgi:hypothetical protein